MRLSRYATFGVAALVAVMLSGCSNGSLPAVTVTSTGTAPSSTPVVTPTETATPTPTPPAHFFTLDETWHLSPQSQPQGSGCAPGATSLPDGIWFGRVTSWSTTQIAFDMECWWTGSGAIATAAARGDEVNNDYYLTNDATTVRVVSVAPDAFALKADVLNLSDPSSWVIHTVADVIADPGGSMPVDPTNPIVWIAVNGGVVTSFAVQYVP
jgi:hypothetical protein